MKDFVLELAFFKEKAILKKLKMKKNLIRLSLSLLTICLILSCKEEDTIQELESTKPEDYIYTNTNTIRTNGKYLDFMSFEEFEQIRDYAYHKDQDPTIKIPSPKELADKLNFYSLGHWFQDLEHIQEAHLNQLTKDKSEAELAQLNFEDEQILFSPEVLDNKELLNLDTNTGRISLKQFDPDIAYLLNKDGVVLIGGIFHQHSEHFIKSMPYTEEFDMNSFLSATTEDKTEQLYFNRVIVETSADIKAESSCRGDIPNTPFYIFNLINHIKSVYPVYDCGDLADCWLSTSQMDCCDQTHFTYVYKSKVYVENTSLTTCPYISNICIGGDERRAMTNLGIEGYYIFRVGNSAISNSFSHLSHNVSRQTYNLYSGDRLSSLSVSATCGGNNLSRLASSVGAILSDTRFSGVCSTSLSE